MALGISIPLALGLFGQSLASIIIDHFGLFGMKSIRFRKKKIIGLVFVAAGIVLMTAF
jgi:transporter family-2 protein